MEQIKATRRNILTAISEHVNMAEVFAAANIDPTEGAEAFAKMLAGTAPKPRKHEDSITFRTNLALFEKAVRPWLAEKGMATARQIAEGVDGLPVNADGKTTTQKVHGILRAALSQKVVEIVGEEDAKAFKKANKISDKQCKVYKLA